MKAPLRLKSGSAINRRELLQWLSEERAATVDLLATADTLDAVRTLQGRAQVLKMLATTLTET